MEGSQVRQDVFRTGYRGLKSDEIELMNAIKAKASDLHALMELKPGREMSVAKTNLEQSVMWAVKGITG